MDKRVVRSKAAIKRGLAEAILIQGYDNVTITEVASRAGVNRKTFYNLYPDIDAVIDEMEDDVLKKFVRLLSDLDFKSGVPDPIKLYEKISMIMSEDTILFETLLDKNNEKLTGKLVESVANRTRVRLCALYDIDEHNASIIASFVINGVFSVFGTWKAQGKLEPIDEVAKVAGRMISGALAAVVTVED